MADDPIEVFIGSGDVQYRCKFGDIRYPDPKPGRGEVGPLILITKETAEQLLNGPYPHGGGVACARYDGNGETIYLDLHRGAKHWVWRLYPAVFADGLGPEIFIGRFPD